MSTYSSANTDSINNAIKEFDEAAKLLRSAQMRVSRALPKASAKRVTDNLDAGRKYILSVKELLG